MPDYGIPNNFGVYSPLFEPVDVTQMARQWAASSNAAAEAQQRQALAQIAEQEALQRAEQIRRTQEIFSRQAGIPEPDPVAKEMLGVALQSGDFNSAAGLLKAINEMSSAADYRRQLDLQERGLDQKEQPKPPKTGVSSGYFYVQDPLTGEGKIVGKLPEKVRAEKTPAIQQTKSKGKTLAEQLEEMRGGKATGEQKMRTVINKRTGEKKTLTEEEARKLVGE